MNRGMIFPALGTLAAAAYGAYELIVHDYDNSSSRFPIFPNGIQEIDPKAQQLSTNPEQGRNRNLTSIRTSHDPEKTPKIELESAPLSYKNVESDEEKIPKRPSEETIPRPNGTSRENASPISSEKPNNASSAGLVSPVASSDRGDRMDVASTSLEKKNSGYEPDTKGFDKVGKHSMAGKYRDNILLVPADHPIGQEKNQKIKEMARRGKGGGLWAYGRGYVQEKHIHSNFANQFCKKALEYSEGTTFWTIGISKKYLDFLWAVCGRDDKPKPDGGWGK